MLKDRNVLIGVTDGAHRRFARLVADNSLHSGTERNGGIDANGAPSIRRSPPPRSIRTLLAAASDEFVVTPVRVGIARRTWQRGAGSCRNGQYKSDEEQR